MPAPIRPDNQLEQNPTLWAVKRSVTLFRLLVWLLAVAFAFHSLSLAQEPADTPLNWRSPASIQTPGTSTGAEPQLARSEILYPTEIESPAWESDVMLPVEIEVDPSRQPTYNSTEPTFTPEPWSPEPAIPKRRAPLRVGKGKDRAPLRYRATWQPDQAIAGQNSSMGIFSQELNVGAPVYMETPHLLIFSGSIRYYQFDTDAIFPDSGTPFPDELWNISVGKNYIYEFTNGWKGGMNLNFGSASDQPFGDLRNYNFGAIGFLMIPANERDNWNLALVYMPMSQIPFPIPSVAYQWNPSDHLSMNIGLPFEISYRLDDQWTLEASYMLLTTIHAQATFEWNEQWKSYASFDWDNQSWFLDARQDDQERLFLYEKRFTIGTQRRLRNNVTIDLLGGYVFDRYFFNGDGFEDRRHDRLDIGSGAFIGIEAALRF